jgi:hypothetical protein
MATKRRSRARLLLNVSTDFIIVPHDDVVARLRVAFPDLWTELLELAYPETPMLMYSGFAELLLLRPSDELLWSRAYRFFDEIAEGEDATSKDILREGAFERLYNSGISEAIQARLGQVARALFEGCRP